MTPPLLNSPARDAWALTKPDKARAPAQAPSKEKPSSPSSWQSAGRYGRPHIRQRSGGWEEAGRQESAGGHGGAREAREGEAAQRQRIAFQDPKSRCGRDFWRPRLLQVPPSLQKAQQPMHAGDLLFHSGRSRARTFTRQSGNRPAQTDGGYIRSHLPLPKASINQSLIHRLVTASSSDTSCSHA